MQVAFETAPAFLHEEETSDVTKSQDAHNNRTFVVAVLSLITAVVLGGGNIGYQVWREKKSAHSNETRLGAIDTQLGAIKTSLRILTETVAPQIYRSMDDSLRAAQAQNKDDAAKTLKETQAKIKQLRDSDVPPDPASLMQSSALLSNVATAHPDLTEAWRTAALLVDYKYQATTSTSSLSDCFDTVISDNTEVDQAFTADGGTIEFPEYSGPQLPKWMAHIKLSDCAIDLDDSGTFRYTSIGRFFEKVKTHHPQADQFFIVLENAHVTYSGGKMLPVSGIEFTNCTFDFKPPNGVPSKTGQALTAQLLAANSSKGTIDLPAGL